MFMMCSTTTHETGSDLTRPAKMTLIRQLSLTPHRIRRQTESSLSFSISAAEVRMTRS